MTTITNPDTRFGPGRTVAVIGAGISGVCAAAHLLKQGLNVTVFERSGVAGGIWHYDERIPESPPYPNTIPSCGDYQTSERGEYAYATPPLELPNEVHVDADDLNSSRLLDNKNVSDLEMRFSPPGPCYAGLKNNVPTTLMVSSLRAWPEGAGEFISQRDVERYVQDLATEHGVSAVTQFNTRVDEATKTPDGSKWEIRSVTLEKRESGVKLVERVSYFDLLSVASGHYNNPRIPDIPGLKEWKAAFPSRVIHSKQYRNPHAYENQNLVILGAGVSSLDICRELASISKKTYQSTRGGQYDLPASLLPPNASRVPEIARLILDEPQPGVDPRSSDSDPSPIPGSILLTSGDTLTSIHQVVVATGYITSYPFLHHLHADDLAATEAGESVLVTRDGDMTHNLHKDIFYIPDPTLAFVGVPYHVSTFSLFDFQAQVMSRVFSGKAKLPGMEDMRTEYTNRLKEKGVGRGFHSLHHSGDEIAYVQELVALASNKDGPEEADKMVGHSEKWLKRYGEMKEAMKELLAGNGDLDKLPWRNK
ncbi:putative monooxygenase [Cladorrhinum samala]|uniref:Monooxygenase n=1 Tax=Cladorrhinum samala TaxID=585594 RepID=A0AAV9I1G8_9PEZI|nr:putative monooxygenase [Cladorrhinum samala]